MPIIWKEGEEIGLASACGEQRAFEVECFLQVSQHGSQYRIEAEPRQDTFKEGARLRHDEQVHRYDINGSDTEY